MDRFYTTIFMRSERRVTKYTLRKKKYFESDEPNKTLAIGNLKQ